MQAHARYDFPHRALSPAWKTMQDGWAAACSWQFDQVSTLCKPPPGMTTLDSVLEKNGSRGHALVVSSPDLGQSPRFVGYFHA